MIWLFSDYTSLMKEKKKSKVIKTRKAHNEHDEFVSSYDPTGAYTGNSTIQYMPEQDADDL